MDRPESYPPDSRCCDRWGGILSLSIDSDDPNCDCPCCNTRRWDRDNRTKKRKK